MDDDERDIQDDELELCFEDKMMEGGEIEDCLGNSGEPIGIWPKEDEDGYGIEGNIEDIGCYRRLVIKADALVVGNEPLSSIRKKNFTVEFWDEDYEDLQNYIQDCPEVERITILGSEFAMRKLKVVDSNFEAFVRGINVSKSPSVVVSCLSKRGDGNSLPPTLHVNKVYYS